MALRRTSWLYIASTSVLSREPGTPDTSMAAESSVWPTSDRKRVLK